jgi:hypothetical protein
LQKQLYPPRLIWAHAHTFSVTELAGIDETFEADAPDEVRFCCSLFLSYSSAALVSAPLRVPDWTQTFRIVWIPIPGLHILLEPSEYVQWLKKR